MVKPVASRTSSPLACRAPSPSFSVSTRRSPAQRQRSGDPLIYEHERLDDLADLHADCVRRFLGGSGGVGELPDLGVEAELSEAGLETLCCWVHPGKFRL